MSWMRWVLTGTLAVAGAAVAVVGAAPDAQAGKPQGGGGSTSPAGQIVFTQIASTGVDQEVWLTDTLGNGSRFTLADVNQRAGVVRARHGGKIWFLVWKDVGGTIGFGASRAELFAVREDGAKVVQLTDDVYFVGNRGRVETLGGDLGISVPACRWAYVDGTPRVVESGHYTAPLSWDANGDVVAPQSLEFTLQIPWDYTLISAGTLPYVESGTAEYTSDGSTAVFGSSASGVWVADLSGGTCTQIAAGDGPRLSPDGTKVVYRAQTLVSPGTYSAQGIRVWDLGTGTSIQVTNDSVARTPVWSPDSQAVAWVRQFVSKSTSRAEYTLRWAPAQAGAASKVIGSYTNVSQAIRWIP